MIGDLLEQGPLGGLRCFPAERSDIQTMTLKQDFDKPETNGPPRTEMMIREVNHSIFC